jgi:peptidoglycan biosynthesis protein MviN/MurJ (putative lipid II flippase)
VATAASVGFSLVLAYHYLSKIIEFGVPVTEIGKQWLAAILMGGVVFLGVHLESTYLQIGHNFLVVLSLVGVGASVYFLVLLLLSGRFRSTVWENLPV